MLSFLKDSLITTCKEETCLKNVLNLSKILKTCFLGITYSTTIYCGTRIKTFFDG